MALSLIKSPAAVNLAGNDIAFKINTDNQYSAEGVKAVIRLNWTSGDAAGDKFSLTWGENTVEFTAAASPDGSGTQYPSYVSGSVDLWEASVMLALQANYLLSRDFDISTPGLDGYIVLTAYEKGPDYTVVLDSDTSNVVEIYNKEGESTVVRDFYGIICKVIEHTAFSFDPDNLLGEDRLTPDTDGNVTFKIQEYLKSLLTFDFEWPEPLDTFLFIKADAIKRFYIQYAETYDGIPKKLTRTFGTATYIMLGGVSQNAQAELNENETTWWDQFLYKKDWLTYQPREITVNKMQPVKLSLIVWKSGVTSVKLRVKVYFTDGTSSNLAAKTISASQYNIIECILSYQRLGLALLGKEVNYYEAWAIDQDDNRLTLSRYFYPDQFYRPNERVFIFQNSLGCPEVVRFTGVTETEVEHDRSEYSLISPDGFTWRTHQVNNFDTVETEKIKFNSGYLNDLAKYPRQFADYLREFYLSPAIWELVNNRLYPVRITGKKQFVNNTDETLSYIEFEAERGYIDKYYTRDENIHPSQGFESKFESEKFLNP